MSGGGKGGSETKQVAVPESLELYAKDMMNMSMTAAKQPYQPNKGPTVAALSPQQASAFQGANSAAGAFGLPTANETGMPTIPVNKTYGVSGYSVDPLYQKSMNNTYSQAFRDQRDKLFTNARTGALQNPKGSKQHVGYYGGTRFNKDLWLKQGPDPRPSGGK